MTSTPTAPVPHPIRVLIVNQTAKAALREHDVVHAVVSLRAQAVEFAKQWGVTPPHVDHAPASVAQALADGGDVDVVVALLDDADQAGALGYHSEDRGVFYARVFALTCEQNGVSWTSCASHELLELIADLAVDRWAQAPDGRLFALEVCDPVESHVYVDARSVELSSYVLPSWFDDQGSKPFDRFGVLSAPFELDKGGYAVVEAAGRVSQVFGDREYYDAHEGWRHQLKGSELSRTHRRLHRASG